MAEIKAFKAYLYSKKLKDDLPIVISPPYDVIKKEKQDEMLKAHPHHSVRICLVDNPSESESYKQAAKIYKDWKESGVLEQVSEPSLYLVKDTYEHQGKKKSRCGFISLLKVSPFEDKEVFPHEHTLSGPKEDRLALLETMGADASQVFLAYEDPELVLEKIFDCLQNSPAYFDFVDASQVRREMWLLKDPSSISALQDLIHSKKLLIADGHHRYETALHLFRSNKSPKNAYLQAYFTNTKSPGFEISAIHRVTTLPSQMDEGQFLTHLQKHYRVKQIEAAQMDELLRPSSEKSIRFICAFGDSRTFYMLERDQSNDREAEIFDLQTRIFEEVFGWDLHQVSKGKIHFENSREEFLSALGKLRKSVGFYLPPTDLKLVMDVVQDGTRMPQKSTFFFPKLASGLVIYELGSEEEN